LGSDRAFNGAKQRTETGVSHARSKSSLCADSLKAKEAAASVSAPLLLAAYRDGRLRYFGHSGTGFSEKGMRDTIERLKPLFTDKPTVENPPKIPEKIQWVRPKPVCEVAYAQWTEDEQLRQTTFLGWRNDKIPEEVVLE
jgi:ATP-dependent DNA ligase